MRPLLQVLSKALVRVLDARVQVADLVIEHVVQVLLVEIAGEALAEGGGKELREVVHG